MAVDRIARGRAVPDVRADDPGRHRARARARAVPRAQRLGRRVLRARSRAPARRRHAADDRRRRRARRGPPLHRGARLPRRVAPPRALRRPPPPAGRRVRAAVVVTSRRPTCRSRSTRASAASCPYDEFQSRFDDYFTPLHAAHFVTEQMLTLTTFVAYGILERHPRLRVAFLETGAVWAMSYVHRLDEHLELFGFDRGGLDDAAVRLLPAAVLRLGRGGRARPRRDGGRVPGVDRVRVGLPARRRHLPRLDQRAAREPPSSTTTPCAGCCATTRCASTALAVDDVTAEMGVFEAIYGLRATRVYDDRPIPTDVLARILTAATRACSSGNTQPWELVVVVRPEREAAAASRSWPTRSSTSTRSGRSARTAHRRRPAARSPGTRRSRTSTSWAPSCSCSGTPTAASACRASTRRTPTARCGRRGRFPGGRGSSVFPACQNMMLAAHALGRLVAVHDVLRAVRAEVKELLHVPPRMFIEARGVPRLRRRAARQAEAQAPRRGRPPERLGACSVPRDDRPIPRIVSADDHVVEPPDVFTSRLPAKYRELGPRVVRKPVAEMTFRGGKYVTRMGERGRRRPLADWWIYEDLAVAAHPARRVCGLRARRRAGRADDLRRDASRLLPARPAPRRHGPQLGRGVAVLPDVPALLRPDVPRGRPTRTSRCCACRRTTTGWSRSGARARADACSRCASIPLWDPRARGRRRCAATPPAACAPCASPSCRGTSACRRCTIPDRHWDPFVARVRRDRHRHLHAQRLGVEDAVDLRRRAAGGVVDAHPRARRGLAGRLAVLGAARALPERDAHVLRGPDRLDPLHPRPGRPGLGAQPGLERLARPRAGAAAAPTTGAASTAASSTTPPASPRSTPSAPTR